MLAGANTLEKPNGSCSRRAHPKNYGTNCSRVVSHRSTGLACSRFTSGIGRVLVFPTEYGRSCS
jgi:hypothetical protein